MSLRPLLSIALLLGSFSLVACEKEKPKADPPPPPGPAASSAAPAVQAKGGPPAAASSAPHDFSKVEFPEVPIKAGATTTVHVKWKAPDGTGVNEEAPFKVRWNKSDALADAPTDVKATGTSAKDGFDIKVKPLDGAPNATLGGIIDLVVCDVETHLVCVPVKRKIDIEFVVGKSHGTDTTVHIDLPQARPKT